MVNDNEHRRPVATTGLRCVISVLLTDSEFSAVGYVDVTGEQGGGFPAREVVDRTSGCLDVNGAEATGAVKGEGVAEIDYRVAIGSNH